MRDLILDMPERLQRILHFREIANAENYELTTIDRYLIRLIDTKLISKAPESRISEWERHLGLKSTGTLAMRRAYIRGVICGAGKLNEDTIRRIVRNLTGREVLIALADRVLKVQIISTSYEEILPYDNIVNALCLRLPAHIELQIIKYQSTWGDIKTKFMTWGDVKNVGTWGDISVSAPVEP